MRRLLAFGAAYILHPPWAKWTHRLLLVAAYVLMGLLGWAITAVPGTITLSGWVVVAGAVISLAGVFTRYYRIEAIGIWPQITGLLTVAIWLQLPQQAQGLSGWLVAAYSVLLGLRLLELNVVAWNARQAMTPAGGTR